MGCAEKRLPPQAGPLSLGDGGRRLVALTSDTALYFSRFQRSAATTIVSLSCLQSSILGVQEVSPRLPLLRSY